MYLNNQSTLVICVCLNICSAHWRPQSDNLWDFFCYPSLASFQLSAIWPRYENGYGRQSGRQSRHRFKIMNVKPMYPILSRSIIQSHLQSTCRLYNYYLPVLPSVWKKGQRSLLLPIFRLLAANLPYRNNIVNDWKSFVCINYNVTCANSSIFGVTTELYASLFLINFAILIQTTLFNTAYLFVNIHDRKTVTQFWVCHGSRWWSVQ